MQVLDDRRAVEDLSGDDLQPRLLHVRDHRQRERVGKRAHRDEKAFAAALRRRDRDQHADAARARMARGRELAHQRVEVGGARARRGAQLGRERGRHERVDEGQAVDDRPVHHAEADEGADAGVLVGVEHGVDRGAVDAGGLREVVDQRRAAGAQRLDRADHRAQVDLPRRQRNGLARPHELHPELERQVLGAAALEVLVGVLVAVDEARHEEPPRQVDDATGAAGVDRSGRRDRGDPVALDEHVARLSVEGERIAEKRDRAAQQRRAHRRAAGTTRAWRGRMPPARECPR